MSGLNRYLTPHFCHKNDRMHNLEPLIFIVDGLFEMNNDSYSKEEEILQVMKKVLTDIAKDTYTPADLKHPLSENTIISIRDCLSLITSREAELAQEAGRENNMRPRYVDEPSSSVVVKLDPGTFKSKKD